jgi:hypothetical protein
VFVLFCELYCLASGGIRSDFRAATEQDERLARGPDD